MSTTNERIKLLRTSLKKTQEEFAEDVGVSRVYVGHLETGKADPSERLIGSICLATGAAREWLSSGNGPMFQEKEEVSPWKSEAFQSLKSANDFLHKENQRLWALLEYFNPDLAKKMGKLLALDGSPRLQVVGSASGAKAA